MDVREMREVREMRAVRVAGGRAGGIRRPAVVVTAVAVVALTTSVTLGCRNPKKHLLGTASAASASAGARVASPSLGSGFADVDAGDGGAHGPMCPPVDPAKVASFPVDTSAITAAVPPIVDPKDSLAPFYDRLLSLARGTAKDHVRVAVYGDSNLTSDYLTGHVRRVLQGRFGDAGHGFVALSRPWAWYAHENVRHSGTWPLFKQIAVTTAPVPGHRYGLAHMAAESSTPGAAAWVTTAAADSPIGRTANRFDVYFLKQPNGGTFDVLLDGKVVRTVSTKSTSFEAGFESVETSDAAHELKCVIKGDGTVRWFGTTLEREAGPLGAAGAPGAAGAASIVIDSLGTGAMNFQRFMLTEPAIRKADLEHRKYDLVIVWLGTNSMWLPPNRAWAQDTITTLRDALPNVPVLVVSPPDSVKPGERHTDPRIRAVVKQLAEVSAETNAAFWDFREAMGGEAAYLEFMKRGLASPDRAHLSREGSSLMGQRLLAALFEGVAHRLDAVPTAGCGHE
jgi:lysophospholipase L1-like esterase